jgi:hypothetical protein
MLDLRLEMAINIDFGMTRDVEITPSKEAFLILYCIVCVKDAMWRIIWRSGSRKWNISFIRAARDWEVDFFASIFNLLYSSKSGRVGEEKLCWVLSKRGLFNGRLLYNVLVLHNGTPYLSLKSVSGTIRSL